MKITPRLAGAVAAVIIFAFFMVRFQNARGVAEDRAAVAEEAAAVAEEAAAVYTPVSPEGDAGRTAGLLRITGHPVSLTFDTVTGAPGEATLLLPSGDSETMDLRWRGEDRAGAGTADPWVVINGYRIILKGAPVAERDGKGLVLRNTWTGSDGTAFTLVRRFRPVEGEYLLDIEVRVEGHESGRFPAIEAVGIPMGSGEGRSFTAYARKKKIRPSYRGDVIGYPLRSNWAGLEERYFAAVAFPGEQDGRMPVTYHRGEGLFLGIAPAVEEDVRVSEILTSGSSATYQFFIGPKSDYVLSRLQREDSILGGRGEGLRTLVYPQGLLKPFMTLFASLIRQLESRILGDFGLAIILVALLMKLTLMSFNRRGIVSSEALIRLQPEITKIRNNPGMDPGAKKLRISEIYRANNIRPFYGIINLLIHLLVFIVISRIFNDLFDFRNASSRVLGIRNLATPDSLYRFNGPGLPLLGWTRLSLLPFLVLGVSFVQSRILQKPHPDDRGQVMMSWLIPVALFVLFYTMPSAALLYWLTQTLVGVVETLVIHRRLKQKAAVDTAQSAPEGGNNEESE